MGVWKGFKRFFEELGTEGFGEIIAFALLSILFGITIIFFIGVITGEIHLSDIL